MVPELLNNTKDFFFSSCSVRFQCMKMPRWNYFFFEQRLFELLFEW